MRDFDHLTGCRLFLHQLKAIFIKKTLLFTRNKLFSIVLVLMPVVLVFIGIEFDTWATVVKRSKDLLFTLERFPKDLVFPVFYPEGYKNCSFVREYAALVGQHGTVKEFELKPVGAKHLRSLSGVNPIAYWLGTFSFDIIVYVVIVALLMLAFLYNPELYIKQDRWVLTLTVLLLYGLTMLPYLYAVQFFFRNPARAVVVMLMITAFIGVLASYNMTVMRVNIPFEGVFYWLHLVFSLVCPNYSLTTTFFFFVHMAFRFHLQRLDAIVLQDLRKQYLTRCSFFVAVHGTSICVPHNECLGLLGQNGAGKSTTFKMLTGDEMISSGNAYMDGLNVKTRMKKIKSMMGYCPQQGALHDTLTGRETLYFTSLGAAVQVVIDLVTLAPHDNKITQYYSGGNKRKLSVGISIIGDPDFIMLDEPTAGMDPIARRKLWDVLHLIRTSGRTLVLTSHSMEECEALCTRIAIMAHGYVLCLGSSQHLKSKYGKGYTVILHAAKVADGRAVPLSEAEKYVLDTLGDSKIFAKQEAYTDIQTPENIPLSFIFEVLENARGQFKFQYYTVQQTSLEQVFLRLLKIEE